MKKVTLALVAVTLSLTACTRVVEVEVAPSDPPETTNSEAQTSSRSTGSRDSRRDEFLDLLYQYDPTLDLGGMDDTYFDAAIGTCEGFDRGLTLDQVSGIAVDSAKGDETIRNMFVSIMATAVYVVCPEYEYILAK